MLVLFDNGTPRTLARYLIDHHAVTEARARGWDELENGALLNAVEAAGFDGQKSELPAKSFWPKDCDCGFGSRPVEPERRSVTTCMNLPVHN
jgi:hypothetical protein